VNAERGVRPLALGLTLSLCGWTGYLLLRPHPSIVGDLSRGWFSDHFSHLHGARAALFGSVNIWREPIREALRPLTAEERASLPPDLGQVAGLPASESYRLPGSRADKPVVVSWSHLSRPYPPGDILAVLPVALVYEFTTLSFSAACHLLIWLFVAYAHVALYLLGRVLLSMPRVGLAVFSVAYFESIHWALEGFYDVAALIPLAWSALAARRKDWLSSLLGYALALFVHFRALFFLPWALLARGPG
jgi:hypothetical protein